MPAVAALIARNRPKPLAETQKMYEIQEAKYGLEVELVSISEDDLLANNWTLKMMDSNPG